MPFLILEYTTDTDYISHDLQDLVRTMAAHVVDNVVVNSYNDDEAIGYIAMCPEDIHRPHEAGDKVRGRNVSAFPNRYDVEREIDKYECGSPFHTIHGVNLIRA